MDGIITQLANIGEWNAQLMSHRAVQCEGMQLTKGQTGGILEDVEQRKRIGEGMVEEETGGEVGIGIALVEEG